MPKSLPIIVLALVFTPPARAAGDHEMLAAQQELKIAKDHLQDAGTDYAGHRRTAMQHIDRALAEIREAIEYSRAQEGGGAPKRKLPEEPVERPEDD